MYVYICTFHPLSLSLRLSLCPMISAMLDSASRKTTKSTVSVALDTHKAVQSSQKAIASFYVSMQRQQTASAALDSTSQAMKAWKEADGLLEEARNRNRPPHLLAALQNAADVALASLEAASKAAKEQAADAGGSSSAPASGAGDQAQAVDGLDDESEQDEDEGASSQGDDEEEGVHLI